MDDPAVAQAIRAIRLGRAGAEMVLERTLLNAMSELITESGTVEVDGFDMTIRNNQQNTAMVYDLNANVRISFPERLNIDDITHDLTIREGTVSVGRGGALWNACDFNL